MDAAPVREEFRRARGQVTTIEAVAGSTAGLSRVVPDVGVEAPSDNVGNTHPDVSAPSGGANAFQPVLKKSRRQQKQAGQSL